MSWPNWAPVIFWRSTCSGELHGSCIVVLCTVYYQNPSSRDWTRRIKSAKDITGPSMATDRKSWQRVVWLLLPSLYVAGIIIDLNMKISLLQVGTTEKYVTCVLVATCWILAVALAVMMEVCVLFWQPFLGTATSLLWICNRQLSFHQTYSFSHLFGHYLPTAVDAHTIKWPMNQPKILSLFPVSFHLYVPFFPSQEIISRVKDQLFWSILHFSSMAGQLCNWVEDCDAL